MTERLEARKATIIAYNNKFAGAPNYSINYKGLFPFQAAADSVPLPPAETGYPIPTDQGGGASYPSHQKAWRELYSVFDKAWAAFRDTA